MPLIEADAKQLEWYAAVFLSQDKVGKEEILGKYDIHAANQKILVLPERLDAKKFLFRLIYGGTAFAYANDPDFTHISTKDSYWQERIDQFYRKYKGLHSWHQGLLRTVNRTGRLDMPTGRVYTYERERGNWPRTKIFNYPVQGFGADLMGVALVSLFKRLQSKKLNTKLVSTVHDSIILDSPSKEVVLICDLINSVWDDIPGNFQRFFGVNLDMPPSVDIKVGHDWGTMVDYKEFINGAN